MTELVLLLCGAVVKIAFKLWIRNDPFTDVLTNDLTDMIKDRVSGVLNQRKVLSRFTQMEEIVADQLLASLQAEFRNLDEGERNAAVIAATATLNQARLTSQILMATDLDSLSLERYIRDFKGTSTRDLSQDGVALYDRILAQCCAYIIELADKLPGFQTDAFGELLSRDRQILARLDDVLARLPTRSIENDPLNHIDVAYRRRLATVLDRLELFGLDFSTKWYALTIAYVNLTLTKAGANQGEGLQEQLTTRPRLLITGRAGSGKTTVLQWLAVRCARQDFRGRSRLLNDRTPFFLRLREYADSSLPTPEEFLDKLAPLLAAEGRDWPRQRLREAGAMVLIDGVDELPESKRPAVGAWLREMIELFPATRYIVTTRPGAANDSTFEELDFVVANLQPMTPIQVRQFVAQWHLAMLEWQTGEQERERVASFERSLLNRIEDDRFLRDLADTPLLAGLICALNLYLNAILPSRRGEIFEKALIMLDNRDQAREISAEMSIDLAASNHLLGDLALWMVRNGVAEAPLDSVRRIVGRSAASLPGGPYDEIALSRHLILRSGLLREPTEGKIDFVHKSFQEYLAAKALVAADNIGELVGNAHKDEWEQVVILSAGQGNTRQTSDLLQGLLEMPGSNKSVRRMRLLAVACIGEIRGAAPEVLAALGQVIPKLIPPRSIAEAETLSLAGERILPFLAKLRRSDASQNASMIRTAALIGGAKAMAVIAQVAIRQEFEEGEFTHAYIETGTIFGELMRAWEYFDPQAYANVVLVPSGLDAVTIQDMRLLRYVRQMPGITSLALEPSDRMIGIGLLDDMPDLRGLAIIGAEIPSLTGIVREWPAMREFTLLFVDGLRDISALTLLKNLEILQISYCEDLRDFSALVQLRSMYSLWLQGQADVDLSVLSGVSSLEDLTIAEGGTVDVRPLANNKDLSIYIFDDTEVVDFAGTTFLPKLRASGPGRTPASASCPATTWT